MPMHADFAKPQVRRWLARNKPSRLWAALALPVLKFDLWVSERETEHWVQMQMAVPQEIVRQALLQARLRKSLERARRVLGLL